MSAFVLSTPDEVMGCLERPSKMADTAAGPVEYADAGEGSPVLCVHGGPGGYDQGLLVGEVFRKNGFRVIAPSRPGYLGTPLATGADLPGQADALAALLDKLGLDRVSVVGVSAAGGAVYELAGRHPDRVSALIPVDCVSMAYTPPVSDLEQKIFVSPLGLKLTVLLGDYLTKSAVQGMVATESTLSREQVAERVRHITSDPLKLAYFKAMMHAIGDHGARRVAGARNDVDRLGAITALPLSDIRCPTLVIHGDADNDVPPEHAKLAFEAIPEAEMLWIEEGSHFAFWLADGAQQAREKAVAWLREKAAA
ncbi:MAG: alpha/beta fold hydrolase [Desulfovibrionaceae bacterium]